jgi:hypothetical protein
MEKLSSIINKLNKNVGSDILILLDGLDEFKDKQFKLINEVKNLEKEKKFKIIITARTEAISY